MPRAASLSFDLLETFVKLTDNQGDAVKTANQLDINQPSMSKRLRYLQFTSPALPRPWLVREGKTWKLTEEGKRALPAVRELIDRYEQLTGFVDPSDRDVPDLQFACGRQAAVGFVREALRVFRREYPEARLQVSTLRGAARIEGVANGLLDLAMVTHDEATIREIARRELHIQSIARHRLAVVCHARSRWAEVLKPLSQRKVKPADLVKFPLILPEPDAGIRKKFDETLRGQGLFAKLNIRLQIGGWAAIMAYVEDRMGVGIVSEAAIPSQKSLVVRYLDPEAFAPSELRLICRRKFEDTNLRDLSPMGEDLYAALVAAAASRTGEIKNVAKQSK